MLLVAEDSEISCEVVTALLGKHGWRVQIAPDGMRAWRMAVNGAYAAILMDCQMPELDGWEATRRIRAAETGFRVPIIAMTGCRGTESRDQCLRAGMDDYLTKPLRGPQLYAAVEHWLAAPTRGL